MKAIIAVLLLFVTLAARGQRQNTFTYGANNAKVYILGNLLFPAYATPDTNSVFGPDASGNMVLRTKGNGGGTTTDSAIFSTTYRNDTGNSNIRGIFSGYTPISGDVILNGGNWNWNGGRILGLNDPSSSDEAVNYGFLQERLNGLSWKVSVLAATTTELPAFTFDGIDNLIFDTPGACPVIDGITVHEGNRLLNKNGTGEDTVFNGIYYVTQEGATGIQCIFTRTTDANTALSLTNATVSADSGIINRGKAFTQVSVITTLNVSPVTFAQILNAVVNAGRGLGSNGNTLYADSTLVVFNNASYANPSFITSLAWSKITGTPPFTTTYAALTDVNLTSLANGQLTKYNSGSGKWENFTPGYITAETDPIATAKTVTVGGGYGISGGGAAQALSSNPSRTLSLDSATVYTAVAGTLAAGYGIAKGGRTFLLDSAAVYPAVLGTLAAGTAISINGRTITNTAPDQTVSLTNGYAIIPSGSYPGFTLTADTFKLATRARLQKVVDSIGAVTTAGYVTNGVIVRVDTYSAAGTYTVTVPAGAHAMEITGIGGGGGAAGCAGTGTTVLTLTGGGGAGAIFKAVQTTISWSSATLTIGAGGSAGAITGCPSCVGANGGAGGNTTFADGTNTYTAPGGNGSITVATANVNRTIIGGSVSSMATGANELVGQGAQGGPAWQFGLTSVTSGQGGDAGDYGKGGIATQTVNTAGNNGTGNGSGGGGCISNAASGVTNSKTGGAGAAGKAIIKWYK